MKALHIDRPVLVGHSIAGEELSSVGSRFPEKVSGLIYLDAATDFALYDPAHPLFEIEMNDIKRRIDEIEAGGIDEKKMLLELETAVAKFDAVSVDFKVPKKRHTHSLHSIRSPGRSRICCAPSTVRVISMFA
jgi:pimeloyl-ACP methyl ester carboxylesterase